ncbi:uncharacterized protein N7515_005573 [Penicillium bovifimosum]|uniref:Metallo-beta-lactamase domain-containing protein n=1 Tax=Penicillium bovifimosum TaxID=126998 RepID=A0A9W9GUL2_9EURO|nr:uncharacterized protein N7515_005573 [Penicillium bovifimosum]KAJ5129534.1 hypothetical protein N7515_005573 [Penicillium bovifimosum]
MQALESKATTPTIGHEFTLQGTNIYIVGTGSHRLIIDTAQRIPEWADIIASTLIDNSISLSHVFLTHWHVDHAGGVPDLHRLYPELPQSTYKNTPGRNQQPIEDGQRFRVEGATIRVVHAQGHSHDHVCFVLEEENAMFTGDNILGHGSSAVEELGVYMASLNKLQAQRCTTGYPAHGIVITDLPGKITVGLAQKKRRDAQVLQTLTEIRREYGRKTASVTVKGLVTTMYGEGIADEVKQQALEPFMDEVLRNLAEDGRVAFEFRGGEKQWFALGI